MLDDLRAAHAIRPGRSFRPIAVVVLCCVSLLGTHSLVAQEIQLTGVANFRDIGGYSTGGGHKIKSGEIFRSGELSGLTPADQQMLAALNIRYEIDLRREGERSAAPSHWGNDAPQVILIPVGLARDGKARDDRMRQLSQLKDAAEAKTLMQQATAAIAIDGAPDIGKVLSELAKGNGPALIHCTAGKDRTGVTVAVLMTLLGVRREDVYHEYMRSNESVDAQSQRQKVREQSGNDVYGLSSLDPIVVKMLMGTDPSYLEAAFHEIDAKYGSFDAYTREGLRISSAQVTQLRKNLVE